VVSDDGNVRGKVTIDAWRFATRWMGNDWGARPPSPPPPLTTRLVGFVCGNATTFMKLLVSATSSAFDLIGYLAIFTLQRFGIKLPIHVHFQNGVGHIPPNDVTHRSPWKVVGHILPT